jgi:hypothetical protein
MNVQDFIKRFCLKPDRVSDNETIHCGYVGDNEWNVMTKLPRSEGYSCIGQWSNGYRNVFINRKQLAIITFCEGDLDVTVHPDRKSFIQKFRECKKFYKEMG